MRKMSKRIWNKRGFMRAPIMIAIFVAGFIAGFYFARYLSLG